MAVIGIISRIYKYFYSGRNKGQKLVSCEIGWKMANGKLLFLALWLIIGHLHMLLQSFYKSCITQILGV